MTRPVLWIVFLALGGRAEHQPIVNDEDEAVIVEVPVQAKQLDVDAMMENIQAVKDEPFVNRILNTGNDPVRINSRNIARLDISPESRLHGAPSERVTVDFLLTNNGPRNTFFVSVHDSGIPYENLGPGAVDFGERPTLKLLDSISEQSPILFTNETRTIAVNLMVPRQAGLGGVARISLEVQPQQNFAADSNNMLRRTFDFTVSASNSVDSEAPSCDVVEDDWEEKCQGFTAVEVCRNRRWKANMKFQDSESGLRSLTPSPFVQWNEVDRYYSYTNFVIGSIGTPVELYSESSCCQPTLDVTVTDVAGNVRVCSSGSPSGRPEAVQSASLSIAIIVIAVVLVLVVIGALVAIFVIRRRRKAELAEMRQSPQAR